MIRFILFAGLISLAACSRDSKKNVLPSAKMQSLLWDLLRADELLTYRQNKDSSFQSVKAKTALYDSVFAIHHINKATFQNSLEFYQLHPDQLKPILDSMQKKTDAPVVPLEIK